MTSGVTRLREVNGAAPLTRPAPVTGVVGSDAPRTLADPSGQIDARDDTAPEIRVATLGEGFVVGYLNPPDAAKYLGMSLSFVETLLRGNELDSYKFGRSRKIRVLDLERWASQQKEPA